MLAFSLSLSVVSGFFAWLGCAGGGGGYVGVGPSRRKSGVVFVPVLQAVALKEQRG